MNCCCKNCINQWNCSWCYYTFCDCFNSPYVLQGKPERNIFSKKDWSFLSEKEKKKMAKKILDEIPQKKNFFLCLQCKEKYINNNLSKGRIPEKIGKNNTTFF